MTNGEILSIADEDGIELLIEVNSDQLLRFARAIAAKEREACAAICDVEMGDWADGNVNVALNNVAAEIRARGESNE